MAQDLLIELSRRGIKLRLVDGRMDVLAPAGALTPDLREQLRLHRDQLLALLRTAGDRADMPQITPQPGRRHEPFPLTDIQHAYWIGRHRAVELGGVSTHYYFELQRAGLDPRRLAESLRLVIDRHDMLRAVIQFDGQQRVLPKVPDYQLPVSDLRDLSAADRAAALARTRADMGHRAPSAESWPLLEIRASLLEQGQVRLHISVNIMIADAFSLSLMFEDWRRFYLDPAAAPEPLPVSYRDYVLAAADLQRSGAFRRAEEYWLERLASLPPAPALPMVKRPGPLAATDFTHRDARLDRDRWAALKAMARTHGLTPSVILMTAFSDVLRTWSGQPAFTLNLTLFDRPPLHPRIGDVIGDFTSLVMLAVAAAPASTFVTRATGLQQQLLRDLEHSSYSGVRVLRERARRSGGPEAAMPVVFTSGLPLARDDDQETGRHFFGDLRYSISQTPQVWLDHQVSEEQGELLLTWDAVEALFPAGLLDDMFAAYLKLLDRLSRDEPSWDEPGQLVRLPAWQLIERDQANATATDVAETTLWELAAARAARCPAAVAVVAADGELTYAQVIDGAGRLAGRLTDLGAGPGDVVAVVLDKGSEQVPAVLGVCASGAAYLPVEPRWPEARRRQLLQQAGVTIAVTSDRLRDRLTWPPGVRTVTLSDAEVRRGRGPRPGAGPSPDDLAYVIFTSGSTGQPKGVMIDHRAAANTIIDINQRFGVGPADRVLALSSLAFDLSVYDIFGMLAAGGAIVMPPPDGTLDPRLWGELADRHGVTIWNSVPAHMQAWMESAAGAEAGHAPGLRLVMLSGDLIPVALPDQVRAAHPGVQLVSLGGATEASIWSVWYPIAEVPADWTRIPYGKPLANQSLHVYDDELRSVPVWTQGELFIGGAGVARGYWRDPEKTSQRFITHPLTGERLYRTGDLARYRPGGDVDFLGRADFQVKINGHRIELGEIAAALRGCAGVSDALADVAVNPATGRRHLVGYVVPAPGSSPAGPGNGAAPADAEAAWDALVRAGTAEARHEAAGLAAPLAAFEACWLVWEGLCHLVMARTLATLGVFTTAGQVATAEQIVEGGGLKARYTGLVRQWLAVLAEEGMLRLADPDAGPASGYSCPRAFDIAALNRDIADQLETGLAAMPAQAGRADPAAVCGMFTRYLRSCADNQVELLAGRLSPLQLLLLDEAGQVADVLYASNPVSHLLNRVAAAVVRTYAEHLAAASPPARILEIGAGTGATSAQILPGLPPDAVRYRFTDVSTSFTQRAERQFAAHTFVEYGLYDMNREPLSQAVAPGSVDVVVAANVLHGAEDLAQTLRYLRLALAPGGVLVAIEGTRNSRIQMISVGFIEGFSRHEGSRVLPLLDVPHWREQLTGAGFTRFASVPDGPPVAAAMVQHVLVAEAAGGRAVADPDRLREALEAVLPAHMVPQHYVVIDRVPLTANGKIDRAALPAPWAGASSPAQVEQPRDATQKALLEIWRTVLGRDDFGVEDNFFELGGDSLHAVRILGRVRDELGADLTADEGLQALFEFPTVATLAEALPRPPASS